MSAAQSVGVWSGTARTEDSLQHQVLPESAGIVIAVADDGHTPIVEDHRARHDPLADGNGAFGVGSVLDDLGAELVAQDQILIGIEVERSAGCLGPGRQPMAVMDHVEIAGADGAGERLGQQLPLARGGVGNVVDSKCSGLQHECSHQGLSNWGTVTGSQSGRGTTPASRRRRGGPRRSSPRRCLIDPFRAGMLVGVNPNETLVEGAQTGSDTDADAPAQADPATKAFSVSILISGIRCVLTYVIFPWVLPLLGFAGGVGPAVGLVVGRSPSGSTSPASAASGSLTTGGSGPSPCSTARSSCCSSSCWASISPN